MKYIKTYRGVDIYSKEVRGRMYYYVYNSESISSRTLNSNLTSIEDNIDTYLDVERYSNKYIYTVSELSQMYSGFPLDSNYRLRSRIVVFTESTQYRETYLDIYQLAVF